VPGDRLGVAGKEGQILVARVSAVLVQWPTLAMRRPVLLEGMIMATKNRLDGIPHPPTTFLLGNLLAVSARTPTQDLMKLARQYGPVYWLDIRGRVLLIVSGFGLVDELCDETRFDKSVRGPLRRVRRFAGDGLFTAETQEPNWAKAHNILLPNFSERAMQGYHPMMLDIAEQLVSKWERLNAEDEIDVVSDMTALTLDTIGLCGFDYRFNSFYRTGQHPFVDAMGRSLAASGEARGLPLENVVQRKRERQLRADIQYMNELVDRIIKERRTSGEDLAAKPDLLSYMLSGVDRRTGERLDDVNIRYQIITFLIAGHETTSGLLSFAIYFLLNQPEVLARAYQEVDGVLGPDATVRPTHAQVKQLVYVAQILKESLRLWPTAPAFSLSPYKDTIIGGKYKINRNYRFSVLVPMLHRDTAVWGDQAEIFNPDNFSPEAERTRPANAYKPFGNGQRACIGRQFAMHEATLVLGMILQRFKLVDHTRYQLKLRETLTIKPDAFTIKVERRTERDWTVGAPIPSVTVAPVVEAAPATAVAGSARHATPLLVLYGSNLGTAEEIARRIGQAGEANGFITTVAPLDAYTSRLPRGGAVVITTSSYNGTAPDNAIKFCAWLRSSDLAADSLTGVTYTVFGCGNRDWASTFQAIPRLIDDRLEAFGARRLYPRGEGDARGDFDGEFHAWYEPLWSTVAAELGIGLAAVPAPAPEPLYAVEVLPGRQHSPFVDSLGAKAMTVTVNRELHTKDGLHPSERSTRHIELELPEGVTYRAGDHLGVVAHNSEALVRRVAGRFGLDVDAYVRLRTTSTRKTFLPADQTISVGRLLGDYVELQDVATRKQIETLAQHTECPWTKPRLAALAADDVRYRDEVLAKRKSLIDLLEEYPACGVPFNVYLEMLSPLRPRYYSISSSPLQQERRCSITVGVLDAPARSGRGPFQGVCSNYLQHQPEGGVIYAFVKDTKSLFRLPEDPSIPLIMIGPGTGLAPFRGFLQERAALKARGKPVGASMLFFGCRHPHQDFIYEAELRAFAREGVTRLYTCFSRIPDERKAYVQDQILDRRDEVWQMIQDGAVVYVCGDASRMAPDVRRAFAAIYRDRTGADEQAAERWPDELARANRYLVDVWAAT
jgi:cytochrome P450/NADPH-cytochrome P450 reductase